MDKNFKILTFGCKTNREESDYMVQQLANAGFSITEDLKDAEFLIINSCTVTQNADDEILYTIRKLKKQNPLVKVLLTGCLAQVDTEHLKTLAEIDFILGNSEKLKIAEFLQDTTNKIQVQNLREKTDFDEIDLKSSTRTRATIKIQDGCDNFCSYCIVPLARGKSRSSKPDNIIKTIKNLVAQDYKEIVISAIHLGAWGKDFTPQLKLKNLLEEIEQIEGLKRYRLGSLTPDELDEELLEFMVKSKKMCNHLHLSLQSATNKTLKNMNRHYTIEETIEKVNYLAENIPFLNIGADVIVGFPGETQDDFNTTFENLKSMPVNYLHIFPYSKRNYTKAASMPDQVDENIKKSRAKQLKDMVTIKYKNFLQKHAGTIQEILVEKNKISDNCYKGLTSNYIKTIVESEKNIVNNIVNLKIEKITDNKIFAKVNN